MSGPAIAYGEIIHVIERSALDQCEAKFQAASSNASRYLEQLGAAQAEIERLNKMLNVERVLVRHLTDTKEDLAILVTKERDALQAKCERLERELESAERGGDSHFTRAMENGAAANAWREQAEALAGALARANQELDALDYYVPVPCEQALEAFNQFKRGGE